MPFALLATLVIVLVAAIAVVGLAGAILVSPYLLVRHLRARRQARAVSGPAHQFASLRSQRAAA